MTTSDPIADMLTRIRNAALVRKKETVMPFSRLKFEIIQILAKEGYVEKVEKTEENGKAHIRVQLKYDKEHAPSIQFLRRVSKPGGRVYVGKSNLPIVRNHTGLAILSTSQGMMTNKQAKKAGLGGEVICEIY